MRNNCDIIFKCFTSLDGIGECSHGNFVCEGTTDQKRCSYAKKEQYTNYWECTNEKAKNESVSEYIITKNRILNETK